MKKTIAFVFCLVYQSKSISKILSLIKLNTLKILVCMYPMTIRNGLISILIKSGSSIEFQRDGRKQKSGISIF